MERNFLRDASLSTSYDVVLHSYLVVELRDTMHLYSILAVATLCLNAVVAVKRSHLGSVSRRNQERAHRVVQEATREKLCARQVNSGYPSSNSSRYLNSATQSRLNPVIPLTSV